MSWFRHIVRSGLLDGDAYQKRRGILLSNYISLVISGALLLLFIIRRSFFGHIPGGLNTYFLSIGLIGFLSPILLNRLGMTTLSRMLLCYAPACLIWYTYISFMQDMPVIEQAGYDSARIHLLAFSFIPYLLLDSKKPHLLILGILPTLISILFFDSILTQFGLGIHQRGTPGEETLLIGTRTFVAYAVISISCYIFQAIITYNDDLNKRILEELKNKSEEIIAQNEELVQSQERLNEINLHLEDLVLQKTANIKQQNERLLKYAHANAHHVRGPVARMLGLIQLSKLKTDLDYPWFFEKVEEETQQVDKIIRGIARELDEIDQNTV